MAGTGAAARLVNVCCGWAGGMSRLRGGEENGPEGEAARLSPERALACAEVWSQSARQRSAARGDGEGFFHFALFRASQTDSHGTAFLHPGRCHAGCDV